jgi:hypothetical protein
MIARRGFPRVGGQRLHPEEVDGRRIGDATLMVSAKGVPILSVARDLLQQFPALTVAELTQVFEQRAPTWTGRHVRVGGVADRLPHQPAAATTQASGRAPTR